MGESHRGVWVAPWVGPAGELVVYSMDARSHLVHPPETIPHGADRVAFADELWAELDLLDPVRSPMTVRPPVFRPAPREGRRLNLVP